MEEKRSIDIIHDANLKILQEVFRVCKKNNIEIMLDSGTLLGAVRHKDFIPWDDDIDLIVKRRDYIRLLDALDKELSDGFELVKVDEYNGNFFDFVSRVNIVNSRLRKPTKEDEFYGNRQNKMTVDLFVLDSASDNALLHKFHTFQLKTIYGMAMGHRYKVDLSKYGFLNKVFVGVLSLIGKHISLSKIISMYEKVAIKYNDKGSTMCFVSNYPLRGIDKRLENEWYSKSVELPLRNEKFTCPAGWDDILSRLYGNYMELPPEDKRQYVHINDNEIEIDI